MSHPRGVSMRMMARSIKVKGLPTNSNRPRTAEQLPIGSAALYRKLKGYGVIDKKL